MNEDAKSRGKVAENLSGTKDLCPKNDEIHAKNRGPKAGRGAIRDKILECARKAFIAQGYDATTMRGVARDAGCDSALVSYYFGSKQLLFRECMNLPEDPAQMVLASLMEGREGAGERLLRAGFHLYEEQLTKDTMAALMRALMADAATSQRFKHYIRTDVIDRVAQYAQHPDRLAEEIEITMATMYGIATMRYIVELEPLASMPSERLVRQLAPLIQVRVDRIFALFES